MIQKFRAATKPLHEQIERENIARHILDHSMDMKTYKLLLVQNYLAYFSVEKQIHRFLPELRTRKYLQLKEDLKALNLAPERFREKNNFSCTSRAEAFGAAYVVEGSALGGMLLSRHLEKCPKLDLQPQKFFGGNRDGIKKWQYFQKLLSENTFSEEQEKAAIEKAKETFRFFGSVFRKNHLPEKFLS